MRGHTVLLSRQIKQLSPCMWLVYAALICLVSADRAPDFAAVIQAG